MPIRAMLPLKSHQQLPTALGLRILAEFPSEVSRWSHAGTALRRNRGLDRKPGSYLDQTGPRFLPKPVHLSLGKRAQSFSCKPHLFWLVSTELDCSTSNVFNSSGST